MTDSDTCVAVIIPAYNAEATLDETLRSVRGQTYRALEIVVVDDGSTDGTRAVGERHAERDKRVRVITQTNGGVAAARNNGIEQTSAPIVAPVDADDLWHPRKIERQMRLLRAGGPETALVYCWSALVDERSIVTSRPGSQSNAGDVLLQLCYGNFVGNGSSALMRRSAVLAAGGYDPGLRARQAQGCEDWKLYLALAEDNLFAVVPDYLIGYRQATSSMSGDVSQMLRSDALVRAEFAERNPGCRTALDWGRKHYLHWLLARESTARNWANCRRLLRELGDPGESGVRTAARVARFTANAARWRLAAARYPAPTTPYFPDDLPDHALPE